MACHTYVRRVGTGNGWAILQDRGGGLPNILIVLGEMGRANAEAQIIHAAAMSFWELGDRRLPKPILTLGRQRDAKN